MKNVAVLLYILVYQSSIYENHFCENMQSLALKWWLRVIKFKKQNRYGGAEIIKSCI